MLQIPQHHPDHYRVLTLLYVERVDLDSPPFAKHLKIQEFLSKPFHTGPTPFVAIVILSRIGPFVCIHFIAIKEGSRDLDPLDQHVDILGSH